MAVHGVYAEEAPAGNLDDSLSSLVRLTTHLPFHSHVYLYGQYDEARDGWMDDDSDGWLCGCEFFF